MNGLIVGLLSIVLSGATLPALAAAETARPNIILIYVDDLSFAGLGIEDANAAPGSKVSYAANAVLTPHISSLASDGARFTRFYVTSPLCSPSRYSVLTGRRASRSSSFKKAPVANVGQNTALDGSEWNIARELKRLGYTTGMVGKWHIVSDRDSKKFDLAVPRNLRSADPRDPTFVEWIEDLYKRQLSYMRKRIGFDSVGGFFVGNPRHRNLPPELGVHNMEWVTQAAIEFIETASADQAPFFLHMAPTLAHGPVSASQLDGDPLVTPGGLLDALPQSQPARSDVLRRVDQAGFDPATAFITWLDDAVGAVLAKLEQLGLERNTAVWFVSDHQRRGKFALYEGTRVPAFVRWPAVIPPGTTVDSLCANIDLAPTFAAMAGRPLKKRGRVDGIDISPLFAGDSRPEERPIFLEIAYARGVVTRDWKYISVRFPEELERRIRAAGNREDYTWDGVVYEHGARIRWEADLYFPHYSDPEQLYDLRTDALEQRNLAASPEHREVLARMRGLSAAN